MGILDDAIKEHLELKRRHGAADDELKQLEDEAFGAAERPGDEESAPDPLAEAPTEFMEQPEVEEESPRSRRPDIADLQEAPPAPEAPAEESAPKVEEPAEEESPAMEHEAVPELPPEPESAAAPEISTGPTTEEREAIAEQPTEMFDIEEELAASKAEAPSEEELVEEEMEEPRLAPVDPLAGLDDDPPEPLIEDDEDDDFWDEKRLSDELDQALEAPVEVEEEEEDAVFEPEPAPEAEPEAEKPPAGPDEDVLEETPDFLEEAPEDDQLWFEQKPPKDFDFDD
jgi:CapZ-interacting protein